MKTVTPCEQLQAPALDRDSRSSRSHDAYHCTEWPSRYPSGDHRQGSSEARAPRRVFHVRAWPLLRQLAPAGQRGKLSIDAVSCQRVAEVGELRSVHGPPGLGLTGALDNGERELVDTAAKRRREPGDALLRGCHASHCRAQLLRRRAVAGQRPESLDVQAQVRPPL